MERQILTPMLRREAAVPFAFGSTLATLALLGASSLLAGCGSVSTDASVAQRRAAIISGRTATDAELYSTVAITDQSRMVECSGTLIAPRVVITAAHCVVLEVEPGAMPVELPASIFRVVEGTRFVSMASPEQVHRVLSITRHFDFSPEALALDGLSQANDIAIMVLTTDASALQPTRIPTSEELELVRSQENLLTIAGYGDSDLAGDASGLLMLAETPYVGGGDAEFMAGGPGHPDTCFGDSGGPAYVVIGGVRRLLGIASRGATRDSACGAGTIFTLAPAYVAWLLDQDALTALASSVEPDEAHEPNRGCGSTAATPCHRGPAAAEMLGVACCGARIRRRRRHVR